MTRDELYRRFVESAPPSDDGYLFERPRTRFWPEPGDELVAAPVRLTAAEGSVRLQLQGASLELSGLTLDTVQAALRALPCSLARLTIVLGPQTSTFIEQTFAKVVFAPAAVAELEARLPALEIVRFPGSPYEVVRAYWRNMTHVRSRLQEEGISADPRELCRQLLEFHRLALTGEPSSGSRSSFYLPASRLGRKRPLPGTLLTTAARVSAPLLGGSHYWNLLAESVSDLPAVAPGRELFVDGLPLGRVVLERAEGETDMRPWFLVPRPLDERYFELLALELERAAQACSEGRVAGAISALAAFHYYFVRLHPLPSANQSLAMSYVNALLHPLLGVGIPHLLLDQLALRFDLPAYRRLFQRAVSAWSVPLQNAADRVRHALRRTAELNAFVSELNETASLLEARALSSERREACRLALLIDE